jgi:cell division protein FtsL
VYGNLAQEFEEVPERVERTRKKKKRKVYPKQKPVAMPSIGASSFVFLTAAVLVTVASCFAYLYVQSGITSMKNQVVSLQAEIAETTQENQEAYEKVMDSVDLAEVYAIATGELGMTQAVDNQVYKYNNSKSNMVKQYGDIPSSTK